MSEEKNDQPDNPEEKKKPLETELEEMAESIAMAQGVQQLEIIRRTGKALEPFDPENQRITGNIQAPFEYYSKREKASWFSRDHAVLFVDYDNMQIVYETEPIQRRGARVTGKVELCDHIEALALTSFGKTRWDQNSIVNFIKRLRPFFQNQSEALELINALKNIDIKVDTRIKKEDNQRGTKADSYKHVADTDLPEVIVLDTPIFKGQPEKQIVLNIEFYYEYSPSAGGLQYWFESKDYEERIDPMVRELIDHEVSNFKSKLPVIYS